RSGSAAAEYGLSSAAAPATLQPEKEIRLVSGAEPPVFFKVGAEERLDITFVVLPGTSAEIPVTVDITGPGAVVDLKGIYLSSGTDKVTFNITMNHLVGGCVSRQLFNGLAAGQANCSFFGKIIVAQDAQKTEAYQENHNIVLSDDARVNTKPQLEIYADNVKCSHGATVGKLNEDEQFYMRSRGIPEDEAKVLQMISFVAPILAGLEDEELTARIENAIRSL
ncbi:MAG: SufD family Fe-S cluster assembly protein, partial [Bacteroidales bacterium]|nr:SufD family Fe-S cluster assembly protein [Bacteroidales bacterium]